MPKKKTSVKKEDKNKEEKKDKKSLRIVSTIAPKSESHKSGLERNMEEIDLEKFSEFIIPTAVGDNVPSLDIISPIRNLETLPIAEDPRKDESDVVSYGVNTSSAYADSGNYVSDSERKYGDSGGDANASGSSRDELVRDRDILDKSSGDFASPELKNNRSDYSSSKDRDYNSGARSSISKKDLGRKREKF